MRFEPKGKEAHSSSTNPVSDTIHLLSFINSVAVILCLSTLKCTLLSKTEMWQSIYGGERIPQVQNQKQKPGPSINRFFKEAFQ